MKTMNKIKALILGLFLILGFVSCNEDLFIPDDIRNSIGAPAISDFEPNTGEPGTTITVRGSNFSLVDTAYIGGQLTEILHRYSNDVITLQITGNEVTGKIRLKSSKGSAETTTDFTVIDITPVVTAISPVPTKWEAYQRYTITGDNLNAIRYVQIGEVNMEIFDQNATTVVFDIPYFESSENLSLKLGYQRAGSVQYITVPNAENLPVDNPVINPVIDEFADQVFPGSTLTWTGEYLDRITNVLFGTDTFSIVSQSKTEMKIAIPEDIDYAEAALSVVHNSGLTTVVKNPFIISTGTVLNYFSWPGVVLAVNDPTGTPGAADDRNFFNASTGETYSPCDYASIKDKIDFFFSISASSIQLNNTQSSDQQLKNFRCNGVSGSVPTERGIKATRYYILKDTIAGEAALKTAIKNKTFTEITESMLDECSATAKSPGSSNPRWLGHAPNVATNWQVGDVLVFRSFSNASNGSGGDPDKFGFIEIVSVYDGVAEVESINKSKVTINVYYQKQKEQTP